jgi:hypothetical protein
MQADFNSYRNQKMIVNFPPYKQLVGRESRKVWENVRTPFGCCPCPQAGVEIF